MFGNNIIYRSTNDFRKIFGNEFVDKLYKDHKVVNYLIQSTECFSDCPFIWTDIIYDFLWTLKDRAIRNPEYGLIKISQLKEKFCQLRIYWENDDIPEEFLKYRTIENFFREVDMLVHFYEGRVRERNYIIKVLLENAGIKIESRSYRDKETIPEINLEELLKEFWETKE